MANGSLGDALSRLGRLTGPAGDAAPDGQLLERYAECGDEAAFAALVRRHGALVRGVCRRLLADPNDADDAFQATFLVLLRRAGSLRREPVGSWLYGVACRVARKARGQGERRRARQRPLGDLAGPAPAGAEGRDLGAAVAEEVSRLPEKYRQPVVLCYLQGQTNQAAARALGWPVGTVKCRLRRARDLLRRRLAGRGVAPSAAGLAAALAPDGAVPPALVSSLIKAAAAGPVPAPVAALCEGAVRDMALTRLKLAAVVVLSLGLAGLGAAAAVQQALGTKAAEALARAPVPAAKEKDPDEPPAATFPLETAQLRKDLAAALGDRFDLLGGTPVEARDGTRYWLAKLRARRAGEFVLCHDTTYQFPDAERKQRRENGVLFETGTRMYRLAIGEAGARRLVHCGQHATHASPRACVGDTLLVPLRVNASDTRHRFRMPADFTEGDKRMFDELREVLDEASLRKTYPPGHVEVRNGARDVLTLLRDGARSVVDGDSVVRTYHHLCGLFEARAPGRFNLALKMTPAPKAPDKAAPRPVTPGELSVVVVAKGRPLTTFVWLWHALNHPDNGPNPPLGEADRTYGSEVVFDRDHRRVTQQLRVGDRVLLFGGQYSTAGRAVPAKHPAVEVSKRPFAAPASPYRKDDPVARPKK